MVHAWLTLAARAAQYARQQRGNDLSGRSAHQGVTEDNREDTLHSAGNHLELQQLQNVRRRGRVSLLLRNAGGQLTEVTDIDTMSMHLADQVLAVAGVEAALAQLLDELGDDNREQEVTKLTHSGFILRLQHSQHDSV